MEAGGSGKAGPERQKVGSGPIEGEVQLSVKSPSVLFPKSKQGWGNMAIKSKDPDLRSNLALDLQADF